MAHDRVIPVIMCGGAGTRLWPVSRESLPKQFIPLIGEGSTFQQTLARVSDDNRFDRPIIITNSDFRFVVAEQIRANGVEADIVLEPVRRDSAAAVAAAAGLGAQRDPNAIMLVLAADHVIGAVDSFLAACSEAVQAASEGRIVTFGIRPTYNATGYGYIRPGAKINGGAVLEVEGFVEKPDETTAAQYVAEGCLWNSGNFMFRSDVMRAEIGRFVPEVARAVQAAVDGISDDLDFLRLDGSAFAQAPQTSIDYAVMEHTDLAAVLPAEFDWSDVGSWDAVWEMSDHDTQGNTASGLVEFVNTKNSFVRSEDTVMTAVVGCSDIVVVATGDAVLVASRKETAQIKTVVDRLRAKNRREAVEHRRIYRPWGYYQGVDESDRYQVKRIVVKPGGKLSLQKHYHRAEHWVVVKGTAEVTIGSDNRMVHENEAIYVPIGSIHRLANPGKIPLELIEVQVGSYLGEDDIIRIEDVYRRN